MIAIDVHYSPRQVSSPKTSSPSPGKPSLVVDDWLAHRLPVRIVEPEPVTREQAALAHDRAYVDGVLDCRVRNGFRGLEPEVATSLPWTCGSLLSAARGTLASGRPTCSPTSGFHHAHFDHGYGYCTFNGLMIAAMVLRAERKVRRVGILDFDQHFGDGTADILERHKIDWVRHVSREYQGAESAGPFLRDIPLAMRRFMDCDLIIYQAGADQHINDPLGGFLTTDQLQRRDRIVFATAQLMHKPLVWNLAGGYQEPIERVLEIHRNTLKACVAA